MVFVAAARFCGRRICTGRTYATEDLRAVLRSAVEADDDILCQFHAKEQILAWLALKPNLVAQIFNLCDRITKEHFRGEVRLVPKRGGPNR